MKYILVSKTWKRDAREIIPTNMKVIKDIVYKLIDLNFKAFINIEEDIYEPLKLAPYGYGTSGSVDSLNNEILNKICFYLSVNKKSNIYLNRGETNTRKSYIYELKLLQYVCIRMVKCFVRTNIDITLIVSKSNRFVCWQRILITFGNGFITVFKIALQNWRT